MSVSKFLDTRKCSVCGKEFDCNVSLYAYKRSSKYFCSYSCMRIYDKKEDKRQLDKQKRRAELNRELAKKRKENNELRVNNFGHQELQKADC